MNPRARFIYNPTAGKEQVKNKVAYILNRLEQMGFETSAHATTGPLDAKQEARRCAQNGFELLVVAGGDGTIYEVINGISDLPTRPKLAIIPSGTSNDFAGAMGIPKQLNGALDIIESGFTCKTDVGRANDHYFINIAGGGSLTEITYEVASKSKTILGKYAYHLKGLEKLPEFKPFQVEIQTEDQTIHTDAMMFLIANSNIVGGFKKFAPYASVTDGMLDVLILKKSNLATLLTVMTKLMRGQHIYDEHIIHFQTSKCTIKTDQEIKLNLDGEYAGTFPFEFEVLPNHLEVFCLSTQKAP